VTPQDVDPRILPKKLKKLKNNTDFTTHEKIKNANVPEKIKKARGIIFWKIINRYGELWRPPRKMFKVQPNFGTKKGSMAKNTYIFFSEKTCCIFKGCSRRPGATFTLI
jgi:hypothetical protein